MIGIDVDNYGDKPGGDTLDAAEARWGHLPPTLCCTSRDDGVSGVYLFEVPEGLSWRGDIGPGIELITAGHRYMTAPPSFHPSGNRYLFRDEHDHVVSRRDVDPEDFPKLPEAWIRGLTEGKTATAKHPKASAADATETWLDSLDAGPTGAEVSTVLTEAVGALDGRDGSRHDSARRSVLRLVNLGHLGHPGVKEALERLQVAYVSEVADDRGGRGVARAEWQRLVAGAVDLVTAEEAWSETPTPLQGPTAELPPFPVDALPTALAEMVDAVAEFTQTPPDLAGVVALGVVSACVGGRVVVVPRGDWREPVNLYLLAVMESGTRKSPVFSSMTAPLLDAQRDLVERTRGAITEAETRRKIAGKRAEQASEAAGKRGLDPEGQQQAEEAAVEAAQTAETIVVPVRPRLIADNITPEATASLLAEQDGRLAIMSAEGGLFDIIAGRYSSKGIPDLDVFLKGHAGDPIWVDRKNRPPEHVPHPALTMVLTGQQAVLRAIGRNDAFEGRGLLARYLYSIPHDNVGHRKVGSSPVPGSVSDAYHVAITGLALTAAESPSDPRVLTLSTAAAGAFLDFERATEVRLREGGDLRGIRSWASKRVGLALRIAGLLHVAEEPECAAGAVSVCTIRAAIRLVEYFTAHAAVAFETMVADPRLLKAQLILEYLQRRSISTFSVRDLHSALRRSEFPTADAVRSGLQTLVDAGWIRPQPTRPSGRSGRPPSPRYDTHPSIVPAQSTE